MASDLNRRDAIRLAMGLGDRIALEREQQSAIDAARGYSTPSAVVVAAPETPRRSRLRAFGARMKARFLRRATEPEA
jgi:hypothetical protein